jgi:AraC-like DNA-binding protein
MDPLTQLVELLRPRALLWKQMVGQGDWAWRFPAERGVLFGRVVSGCCRFELPGIGERSMKSGDYLLLTAPPAWILRGGDGDAAIVDFENLPTDIPSHEAEGSNDDPGQVRIVGGHFEFDSVNEELLMAFLSPMVHVRSSGSGDGGPLTGVFAMIDAEASAARPGQEAVLSRLLEIVLIEILRAPEMPSGQQRGMLIGLTDPQIASALRAFHADIRRGWSVASMAAEARMSRSVLSRRFVSLVGQPPMTYALQWRMAVARDALRFGGRSLDEIARATGYSSASAFSTAFTRTVGRSPARFARDGGGAAQACTKC